MNVSYKSHFDISESTVGELRLIFLAGAVLIGKGYVKAIERGLCSVNHEVFYLEIRG